MCFQGIVNISWLDVECDRKRRVKFKESRRSWETGKIDLLLIEMGELWVNNTLDVDQGFSLGYVYIILRHLTEILYMWAWSSGENFIFASHLHIDDFKNSETWWGHQRSEYTERKGSRTEPWEIPLLRKKKKHGGISKGYRKDISRSRTENNSTVSLNSSEGS